MLRIFLRGAGLLVSFREGATEDPRARDEDLGYYAMRLEETGC